MRRTVIDAAAINGRGLRAALELGCHSLTGSAVRTLAPTTPAMAGPATGARKGVPAFARPTFAAALITAAQNLNAQGTHPPRASAALL